MPSCSGGTAPTKTRLSRTSITQKEQLRMYSRSSSKRVNNHKHEITYKIQVWEWISIRHSAHGDTFRVSWLVANRRKGRTFRSYALAKAFQDLLRAAYAEGQPFDTRTGMPLSVATRPRRKARRRRHEDVEGLLD